MSTDPLYPHFDDMAEPSLIGAVLMSPPLLSDAARYVEVTDFGNVMCGAAWRVMMDMLKRRENPDTVTLNHRLKLVPEFQGQNTLAWIIRAINDTPWCFHATDYARIVHEDALKRRALRAADNLKSRLQAGEAVTDVLDEHGGEVERLENQLHVAAQTTQEAVMEYWDRIDERRERGNRLAGMETGFPALDNLLSGLQPGYHLLGARPGVGKTAMLCNLALNLFKRGKRVLFVSLEMTTDQILTRFYSTLTGIPTGDIIAAGRLGNAEYRKLIEAQGEFYQDLAENVVIHTPHKKKMTPTMLAGLVTKEMRAGLDAVFVDYLGLMAGNDRYKTRYEEVTSISAGLLSVAMDNGIPLVCASQLNRRSTERADRKPDLADLRESGALEQDAHTVWLLWRPDEDADNYDAHMAELEVAKNRFGPTGMVQLYWDGAVTRFLAGRVQGIDLKGLS